MLLSLNGKNTPLIWLCLEALWPTRNFNCAFVTQSFYKSCFLLLRCRRWLSNLKGLELLVFFYNFLPACFLMVSFFIFVFFLKFISPWQCLAKCNKRHQYIALKIYFPLFHPETSGWILTWVDFQVTAHDSYTKYFITAKHISLFFQPLISVSLLFITH